MFKAIVFSRNAIGQCVLTIIAPKQVQFHRVSVRKYSFKLKPNRDASTSFVFSLSNVGIAGYCMLSIPLITFSLGTWQIQRRKWKLDLIRNLEEKRNAPPIELPHDLEEMKDLEYCRVRVTGKFDHSKELYIRPRSLLQHGQETGGGLISSASYSGSFVVTPFNLSDRNVTILVNRGWVSRKKMDPKTRLEGQIEEEIELVGVLRHSEKKTTFVPENQENSRFWHSRDVLSMATMCDALPIFLDADAASSVPGGPIGGQTRVSLRNEHLSYILTWYTLCAATSFLWYKKYARGMPLM